MPHIHLEYTDNLKNIDTKDMLLSLNQALIQGGYAKSGLDIKSRAICQTDYMIGENEKNQAYIHVKLSLLTGRSDQLKREISERLLEVLKSKSLNNEQLTIQLCVELLEMPVETYSKHIIYAE